MVVKRYDAFTPDAHVMMGKYVREEFKEAHRTQWKKANPTQGDVIETIIRAYATEARWQKSVQHLAERGMLESDPRDIGSLIREVKADVRTECETEIRDLLFQAFWPQIERRLTAGLPEWYKRQLVERAFPSKGFVNA